MGKRCAWCGCGLTLPLERVGREWVCADCMVERDLQKYGAEAFDMAEQEGT